LEEFLIYNLQDKKVNLINSLGKAKWVLRVAASRTA
jgi:hypothetical protein